MATKITQALIERAKPGEYADETCRGLRLIVSEHGSKSWEYRYRFDGRLRRIRLGQYDKNKLGIAQARDLWRDAQKLRDDGIDPHEHRAQKRADAADQAKAQKAKRTKDAFTVAVLGRDYLEHRSINARTIYGYRSAKQGVDRIVEAFGDRPVASITRHDARELFETLTDTPFAANRMVEWGRAMWNFAIDRDLVESNPWQRIKVHVEKPRDRVLSKSELRRLLEWLDGTPMHANMVDLCRMILLTGCRPNEIAGAKPIDVDIEARTLTVPVTKNNTSHVVHLSEQAWRIVEPRLAGGKWLFESHADRPTGRALHADSLGMRVRKLHATIGVAEFQPRDLRRTMASWLGEQETCTEAIIDRMLNHRGISVTARHYNWARLNVPAARWWQAWADHLTALQADNVAELHSPRDRLSKILTA